MLLSFITSMAFVFDVSTACLRVARHVTFD